jgi:hypothetical protein
MNIMDYLPPIVSISTQKETELYDGPGVSEPPSNCMNCGNRHERSTCGNSAGMPVYVELHVCLAKEYLCPNEETKSLLRSVIEGLQACPYQI